MTGKGTSSRLDKVPENLRTYVEILGEDDAMNLFLFLGGTSVYLPAKSGNKSLLSRAVGAEKADALAAELGAGYIKVPIARQWIADTMFFRGHTNAEIARVIRCDESTVRSWFNSEGAN